jgi:hypothetical protein
MLLANQDYHPALPLFRILLSCYAFVVWTIDKSRIAHKYPQFNYPALGVAYMCDKVGKCYETKEGTVMRY